MSSVVEVREMTCRERKQLMSRASALFAGLFALMALSGPGAPRAVAQALPVFSPTGPDAAAYGEAEGYPVGTAKTLGGQRSMVGTYSHYDAIHPTHPVAAPTAASRLDRAAHEISITWGTAEAPNTVDTYLATHSVTGLLLLRGRTILMERYRYARTDKDRFTTQSVAKTIVAMLAGIALAEGKIHSLDDEVAAYVPELAGTEPGRTKLRALLEMSSGLAFREVYNGKDDIADLGRALLRAHGKGTAEILAQFNHRVLPQGTVFNYAGLDTELLGLAVARASGTSLAELLSRGIWNKIGAEASGHWTIDTNGHEVAYCCLSATLRDWGRLGALLAADGVWDGQSVIPRDYLIAATSPHTGGITRTIGRRALGYGYQVWLLPGPGRQFALRGLAGQAIFIDPQRGLVMVHTAVRNTTTDPGAEADLLALWEAFVAQS